MTRARILPPILIVSAGIGAAVLLWVGRPVTRPADPEPSLPAVRVVTPESQTIQLRVRSQGTVTPRTESDLVAEVPGRVTRIAPGLEPGAFFRAGGVLAELDRRDFELAVSQAQAALERAVAERDFARATLGRRETLAGEGIASAALLDEARREARIADARLQEAVISRERARRDLERTRIVAPYDGRVRSKQIDVGQFVATGSPLARIYAVDYAEVRLPVPDEELAFLELPLGSAGADLDVVLRARFAGGEHEWRGEVVRTEAEIDPRTRMVQLVARVPNPYAEPLTVPRPPLAAGLFVEAEIMGRRIENALRVPRAAVDAESVVWIVDDGDRLRPRNVEVVRVEDDVAWVTGDLAAGERVTLSRPLDTRDGLAVRPVDHEAIAAERLPGLEPAS